MIPPVVNSTESTAAVMPLGSLIEVLASMATSTIASTTTSTANDSIFSWSRYHSHQLKYGRPQHRDYIADVGRCNFLQISPYGRNRIGPKDYHSGRGSPIGETTEVPFNSQPHQPGITLTGGTAPTVPNAPRAHHFTLLTLLPRPHSRRCNSNMVQVIKPRVRQPTWDHHKRRLQTTCIRNYISLFLTHPALPIWMVTHRQFDTVRHKN